MIDLVLNPYLEITFSLQFFWKKKKKKKNNELEVLEVLGSKGINKLIPFW